MVYFNITWHLVENSLVCACVVHTEDAQTPTCAGSLCRLTPAATAVHLQPGKESAVGMDGDTTAKQPRNHHKAVPFRYEAHHGARAALPMLPMLSGIVALPNFAP